MKSTHLAGLSWLWGPSGHQESLEMGGCCKQTDTRTIPGQAHVSAHLRIFIQPLATWTD